MTQRTPNIIDTIAGFVPGYRGYADRESRRIADKALRAHVAETLDRSRRHLDAVTNDLTKAGRLEGLDEIDRLKRLIGTCADTIRYAPAGGSGLMDDVVVKADDLDRAHRHDLELEVHAREAVGAVEAISPGDAVSSVPSLRSTFQVLQRDIEKREDVLREVFS